MKKAAPKKKAPVQLTAGTGFRNENCIGARFLLDLLAGTNTLGVDFGKIDRLQWQGRDRGWLADDLVVECTASTGKRPAGISIKSDRQVTSSGFPPDFVGIAWAQWFGVKTERVLRGSDDAVALMVGSLAHDVEDAWSNLLSDALQGKNVRCKKCGEAFRIAGGSPPPAPPVVLRPAVTPEEIRGGIQASPARLRNPPPFVEPVRSEEDYIAKPPRQGNSTLKILLIVFGSLAALAIVVCGGIVYLDRLCKAQPTIPGVMYQYSVPVLPFDFERGSGGKVLDSTPVPIPCPRC